MRTFRPLLFASLLVVGSGCALFTLATKSRSWPRLEGRLEAPGLVHPVRVFRDELGVPHVRAATEADAWYAVGFVHAQDRLFQADLNRRIAFGGLAELVGEDAAGVDAFMRSMRLEARARASLAALPADTRQALGAYARGMNDGARSLDGLPVEYRLTGATFAPWRPEDSLAVLYLNSWFLAMNPLEELHAFLLRKKVDREAADLLLRTDLREPPLDAYWDDLRQVEVGPFTPEFRAFMATLSLGDPSASNNWAVSGARTASGKPIVANDPHLVQRVPSVWYVVDAAGGELHVAGGTMPGLPFVLTGHNARVAWGLTNVMADYVDLAVLDREGDGYVLEGRTLPFDRREVQVRLPGGETVKRTVPFTELGPVLTELDAPAVLAMRWSALELEDHSAAMVHHLDLARSATEIFAEANAPATVNQNLVVGDVEGNIGWAVTGVAVKRRHHTGRVPYLASREGEGWAGFENDLPKVLNPERGFVQTANARPDAPQADLLSSTYIPPWRHERIGALLDQTAEATPEDMHRIQLDVLDTRAAAVLPKLLEGAAPKTELGRRCLSILRQWDRVASRDSVGTTVWAMLQRQVVEVALEDDLGPDGLKHYFALHMFHDGLLDRGLERFLPDRRAGVSEALDRAGRALEARYGAPSEWAWGEVHPLQLRHPFSKESALLDGWDMLRIPWPGTVSTVAQAGFDLAGEDWETTWLPSIRIVTPLDAPGRATVVYPGGQSGQPGHPDYRSFFEAWRNDETRPLWFEDADVKAHATRTLVLEPSRPAN